MIITIIIQQAMIKQRPFGANKGIIILSRLCYAVLEQRQQIQTTQPINHFLLCYLESNKHMILTGLIYLKHDAVMNPSAPRRLVLHRTDGVVPRKCVLDRPSNRIDYCITHRMCN